MANAKKILLVEGEADKSFFKQICKNLSLDNTVKVALPKELGDTHNTKGGVINQLILLQAQLEDGQITNIAAIIDADYKQYGSGKTKTLDDITERLRPSGFEKRRQTPNQAGIYFDHDDGLPTIGLWIMPNNQQEEGMLEDWIKSCIGDDKETLFKKATTVVQQLNSPKFKPHLTTKAEIATWLAWQATPGHGLYHIVYDNLLDENAKEYKQLCQWLKAIF
jgi:hypothetical protein